MAHNHMLTVAVIFFGRGTVKQPYMGRLGASFTCNTTAVVGSVLQGCLQITLPGLTMFHVTLQLLHGEHGGSYAEQPGH
jgi:hypothetical protein